MRINFKVDYTVDIADPAIENITAVFKEMSIGILSDLVRVILEQFAIYFMDQVSKPFSCEKCGNSTNFIWKTKRAKDTKITTIFGEIKLPQMQIKCKGCGKKMYITRKLLGIGARKRMSEGTQRILALLGVLAPFRVTEKMLKMVGVKVKKMTVWRCVQRVGEKLEFGLDKNAKAIGEADGTGVRIQGIKKYGRELKVFVQHTAKGIRVAGISIGKYHDDWDALFRPLKESLKRFKNFLIITDGDTAILRGLEGVKVLFQRCLWHLPHQMKYYLWKDGIKRKSEQWYHMLGAIIDITALRYGIVDDQEIQAVIETKMQHLDSLIAYCKEHNCEITKTYLENARDDMFTAFRKKLRGKTISKTERVMRTVKLRTAVGKWSPQGALNAVKVRLAHYYNGFDPTEEKDNQEMQCFRKAA